MEASPDTLKPSPPDSSQPSPRLPWEVIERVIGHSCPPDSAWRARNPNSAIFNFSLTCRDLRPRSLCILVADVSFCSRDQIFDFCDFLQANPHLKPFVHTVSVSPSDFAPVPLLRILPNLSSVKFEKVPHHSGFWANTTLNQTCLTCSQLLSRNIQTLSLSKLYFTTWIRFSRLLSALPRIAHLVCWDVQITKEGDTAPLHVAKQRLSQRLRLLTIDIGSSGQAAASGIDQDIAPLGRLLLDSGLVQSTLQSLTVEVSYNPTKLLQQFNWPRLRFLALKVWTSESKEITRTIAFLNNFHHIPNLKEIIVKVHERAIVTVSKNLAQYADLYKELEHTLLKFSHPQLIWTMMGPFIAQNSFWAEKLRNVFPVLSQRGKLVIVPYTGSHPGHSGYVQDLVISPNSNWAASGDFHGNIIIWNTATGAIVQQWVSNGRVGFLHSLAFSPNSQYLVSVGGGIDSQSCISVVWDLGGDLHQVLEGHTSIISVCAWSPSPLGDVIATGSRDTTALLWDANTLQILHVLEHPTGRNIQLVKFSPDGRWLLTGCDPNSYYIWDVASGTGKQLREPTAEEFHNTPIAGAFNLSSTRLALASPRGIIVKILETDGGEWGDAAVFECGVGELGSSWETRHIAFSPGGNLVLTVSVHDPPAHTMKVWDAHTGAELLSLEGHKKKVSTACFSPCGKYIASASWDQTVRLWRTYDGSCIATLTEHNSGVTHVTFSPNGKALVTGDEDGEVIIRQMCNGLPIDKRDP